MKKISDAVDKYLEYVGEEFTCPKTEATYKIESEDVQKAEKRGHTVGVRCPDCGKLVTFEADQRDGIYVSHA